jgi:hypothetical protein
VFVRQDIPAEHQNVQSLHAVFSIATLTGLEFAIPNIITIGVPDKAALHRVVAKLQANQIPHYAWMEPDFDFGFTAIATTPLDAEQKQILMNYRLLKFKPENFNALGVPQGACSLSGDEGASSRVS